VSGVDRLLWRRLVDRPHLNINAAGLAGLVIASEVALLVLTAMASGVAYHLYAYGQIGPVRTFAAVAVLAALLYVLPHASKYALQTCLKDRRSSQDVVLRWHAGLLLLGVVAFLTKTTSMFSRAWMVIFYVGGLVALLAVNAIGRKLVRTGVERGHIAARRLMLVGASEEIAKFWDRRGTRDHTDRIVSIARLPTETPDDLGEVLSSAVEHARLFGVDAVLILPGNSSQERISRCVDALSALPVSIHLDAGPALDRVQTTEVQRIGDLAALTLADRPLGPLQSLAKRAFDIAAASAGLVLLAPVFAAVAIMIKRDSPGPVFFRQRRRGYNQREFRIVKFRSMSCMDDGDVVRQAKAGDARITPLGEKLRKYNLDELPQLWNVLVGDMSLVGPRPHAVAHDKLFEKRIGKYPRRLNVKPGITGWAQVNGFRGETDTDDKMERRVEYDLDYIDNWSLWLDIKIVLLTVLSRRAYTNAR
jgi:polysaccharide biosynthesis protein PslA